MDIDLHTNEHTYPYWPDPNSNGFVDAWNGWYETEIEALAASIDGLKTPDRPRLPFGSGLVSEADWEEMNK